MAFLDAHPTLAYLITWLICVACFGTLFGFAKWRFDRLEKKQETMENLYHQCQLDLPKTYASKPTVDKLFGRVDKVEKRLEYIKGLRNGKKNEQPRSA